MSDRFSVEDAAELQRRRSEEIVGKLVDERVERFVCEVWDVEWKPDGSHKTLIRAKREQLDNLVDRAEARRGFFSALSVKSRDKLFALFWTAAASLGGMWLSKRFGFNIFGGTP